MNGAALPFKQAVGSNHRVVVDNKVHFERQQAVVVIGNRLRKALGATLSARGATVIYP
jgi:hypothetical protein